MAARPTKAVRLLPGHDQWVMGPGTKDQHVVPLAHRATVTQKSNLVVARGVVNGIWSAQDGEVRITWFGANGRPPRSALANEVARLAVLLDRPLTPIIDTL